MKKDVYIFVGTVEADTRELAYDDAMNLLENLAGSNHGSEVLANATPILVDEGEFL